jgi:hypothetical protein
MAESRIRDLSWRSQLIHVDSRSKLPLKIAPSYLFLVHNVPSGNAVQALAGGDRHSRSFGSKVAIVQTFHWCVIGLSCHIGCDSDRPGPVENLALQRGDCIRDEQRAADTS